MSTGLTIHVPMTFQRRGGRKMIVMPNGAALPARIQRSNVDSVLLKALARAFRWQKLLDEGTCPTIKEIATKEKLDSSYIGEVLRLTLLAPDIVEMVLDGRQPQTLKFKHIRKKAVPYEWNAQRESICRRPGYLAFVVGRAAGPVRSSELVAQKSVSDKCDADSEPCLDTTASVIS